MPTEQRACLHYVQVIQHLQVMPHKYYNYAGMHNKLELRLLIQVDIKIQTVNNARKQTIINHGEETTYSA